ncbi:MAG: hypothetical protein DMF69_24305 [Acidobacteria bacterium]|nr:MAG: hypothetical protein DMF69_24305 [Acidobacteriota bacterium]
MRIGYAFPSSALTDWAAPLAADASITELTGGYHVKELAIQEKRRWSAGEKGGAQVIGAT